jgi:hypothetical protein
VDAFGIQLSVLHDFLDLDYHALGRSGHVSVKVTFCLFELQVSHSVSPLGLYQSEIPEDRLLHQVFPIVEDGSWL